MENHPGWIPWSGELSTMLAGAATLFKWVWAIYESLYFFLILSRLQAGFVRVEWAEAREVARAHWEIVFHQTFEDIALSATH